MAYFLILFYVSSFRASAQEVSVVFLDQASQPLTHLMVRVSLPNGILVLTTDEKGTVRFKTRSDIVLFDLAWRDANRFYSLPDAYRINDEGTGLTVVVERSRIPGFPP